MIQLLQQALRTLTPTLALLNVAVPLQQDQEKYEVNQAPPAAPQTCTHMSTMSSKHISDTIV